MAPWRRRRRAPALASLVLLGLALQGCVTGHLLDAARRREQVLTYRQAFSDGERLIVHYTALVSDDAGDPLGQVERWASLAIDDLRRDEPEPVDAFPVRWLTPTEAEGGDGEPLVLCRSRPVPATPALAIERVDGRDVGFVLRDQTGARYASFASGALTRVRVAPWVYPLLPFTAAVDAVTNPVLLFFAPAVILVGD